MDRITKLRRHGRPAEKRSPEPAVEITTRASGRWTTLAALVPVGLGAGLAIYRAGTDPFVLGACWICAFAFFLALEWNRRWRASARSALRIKFQDSQDQVERLTAITHHTPGVTIVFDREGELSRVLGRDTSTDSREAPLDDTLDKTVPTTIGSRSISP